MATVIPVGYVKKGNPATNRLTFVVGVPAHDVGDQMYIAIADGLTDAGLGPPAGWDILIDNTDIGNHATFALFTKTAEGDAFGQSIEPATVEVSTVIKSKAVWICWTVTEDDGINAQGVTLTNNSALATIPTLTTTAAACLVLGIVATDDDSAPLGDAPATWAKLDEHTFGRAASIGVYYKTRPLSDVEPAVNVTLSSSERWIGVSFAITPAIVVVEPWRRAVTLSAASATPDDAALSVQRTDAVTLSAASATPDAANLTVQRVNAVTLSAASATPDDVVLHLTSALRAVATLSAQSASAAAALSVHRATTAALSAQSATAAAALSVHRLNTAILSAASATGAATLIPGSSFLARGGVTVQAPSATVAVLAPSIVIIED